MANRRDGPDSEPLTIGGFLDSIIAKRQPSDRSKAPDHLANRAAALKKTAELKALGIDDYFIVQDEGKTRWAVSLGVFSTEESARSRLEALRAKGVRSAQTGERETQVPKLWFQVRGADAPVQARLRELVQALPGTELRNCP